MNFKKRGQQRIEENVSRQAVYVADTVEEKIEKGMESPYVAYARVKGLSPGLTEIQVGQAAVGILGEGFKLVATKDADSMVREGAIIHIQKN